MEAKKDNSVVIFKNENRTSETQPQYRGTMVVDGKEKQISLWVKESQKDGKKFFSGIISEPYKKTESKPAVKEDEPPF
jgi:hypothetical protein